MSSALAAKGTLLKIGDGGGTESFTTIAEVTKIGGPKLGAEVLDVTSHSSTSGWREFIAGLLDGGEVTFTINYVPTNATHNYAAGLLKDFTNRTLRNFKVVWPDSGSTTWAFAAIVKSFEPDAPVDGKLESQVTLKISGVPTLV